MTITDLPLHTDHPTTLGGAADRWQPTRAGIINVWQYADETFEFESGRLVFYGTNGSGKTMALELLVPYLLDANASPARLSTAGGTERGGLWSRMAGDDETTGRTGYLWLEFGRRSSDGHTDWFSCGCRLELRRGGRGRWTWFTTTQRPGIDLGLLDTGRVPLDPAALRNAIGDAGTVWGDDAVSYRNAVRSTLYAEFRPEEYQALIDGLLAVRKQSITDSLSPENLHRLLTGGLPALDPAELDGVARGFEQLDARRDTIDALDTAVGAATALAERVREYSRTALRLLARAVTTADSQFDGVRRREVAAQERYETARSDKAATEAEIDGLERDAVTLGEQRDAILGSPQYANVAQLDVHRRRAVEAETAADRANRHAVEVAERADRDEATAAASTLRADDATAAVTVAVGEMGSKARAAGVNIDPANDPSDAVDRTAAATATREHAVDEVDRLLAAHEGAVAGRDRAARATTDAEDLRARRVAEHRDAQKHQSDTEAAYVADVERWAAALVELTAATGDTTTAARRGDIDAVVAAADAAARDAILALRLADAGLADADATISAQIDELNAEAERLTGTDDTLAPSAAPWRAERDPDRPGAALWALLRPRDGLDGHTLDGIEAALDAAGLLDAWVHPDATVTAAAGDVVAVAGVPVDGAHLGDWLEVDSDAATDAGVDTAAVSAVLAATRVGTSADTDTFTIGSDATFSFGAVRGRAELRPARHIGAAARDRARRARLDAIAAEIANLDDQRNELAARRGVLAQRLATVDGERQTLPSPAPVIDARGAVALAQRSVADADERVVAANEEQDRADAAVRAALLALNRAAANHAVPTERRTLDALRRRLRDLDRYCGEVRAAIATAVAASERSARDQATAAERRGDADAARVTADELDAAAVAARAAYDTLAATVGADAQRAEEQLSAVRAKIAATEAALRDGRSRLRRHDSAEAEATAELASIGESRAHADEARQRAVARFRNAVAAGVADDAGLAVDGPLDSLTAVVVAAGAVRSQVRGEPTVAHLAAQLSTLNEERFGAGRVLGGRADLSIRTLDEPGDADSDTAVLVSVASAVVDGTSMPVRVMVARFEAERDRARAELEESETRLFEETLTGSLRAHLASRLRAAQALVDNMNTLLSQIRSASGGVGVSLRWDVHDDLDDRATVARAKELLLRDHHSADERTELQRFLTRRITAVRGDDASTASWRDALEALFDYRDWHRFTVMVRHDRFGDRSVPLTSRRIALSAGEKALVLSVPLFAAIASHYMPRDVGGDARRCPRLLLLDEVFPKNDRANKRQILGLLTQLDLDCVLTSDKDMCDYDTVDAIAIAVIARDGDTSYATRLVWNGRQLIDPTVDDAAVGV